MKNQFKENISSQQLLASLYNSAEDAIILKDLSGKVLFWNKGAENIYGYNKDEILGQSVASVFPQDRLEELKGILNRIKKGEIINNYESINVRKNGEKINVSISTVPFLDYGGSIVGVLTIARDVTSEQKQKKFEMAIDAAPNGILMINRSGLINLTNTQVCKMFGYSKEELFGERVELLVPNGFQEIYPKHRMHFFEKPLTQPMGAHRDLFSRRKDGSEFPVEIGLNPFSTDEGTFVIAAIVDITERKRESQKFQMAVEAAPNGMIMVNKMGAIELVNHQCLSMFKYTKEELVGQKVENLVPERFRVKDSQDWTNFFSRPQARPLGIGREFFGLRKDGSEFPVEIGINPVSTDEGTFVLASIIDITERKRHEEMLEQFAFVVSHDLKAPLRGIASVAEWIIQDNKDNLSDKSKKHLDLLANRLVRMQNLIDGILEYSRVGRIHEEPEMVDFNKLVPQVVDSLNPPKHIKIKIQNNLPTVAIAKTGIQQVFQNILSNAINYMDKKEGFIEVGCTEDDNFWEFFVKDNGPGIEKKHFEKIFQLFQTLAPKDAHESTGIGLALVKKIVELYGGKVWVESEIKKGSTFFFNIPKLKKGK